MTPGRLLLLDSATLYYRAFHALPTSLRGPDGSANNALRGFCDALPTLVTQVQASHMACAWDVDWRPAWRVKLWPQYKSHRVAESSGEDGIDVENEETPDELAPQVDTLARIIDAAGLARVGAQNFEADDVIATLAQQWPGEVVIVTSDRDLLQCVTSDGRVRLLSMARGLSALQWYDGMSVQDRYGVLPERYADFATLRGDTSDGLPGVKGIGEKTAAALVREWAQLDELIAAAQRGHPNLALRVARALVESAAQIPAWAEVTRVRSDISVHQLTRADDALAPEVFAPITLPDAVALPGRVSAAFDHRVAEAGVERAIARWRPRLID